MKVFGIPRGSTERKRVWIYVYSGIAHNPKPSTAKGKRRHEKRTPEQKKLAEAAWGKEPAK